MQLVAYGAQDVYLTGNPQITFFKVVYRRHTNFACEAIEQTFNGKPELGGRATVPITRNGDLVTKMWLKTTVKTSDTLTEASKSATGTGFYILGTGAAAVTAANGGNDGFQLANGTANQIQLTIDHSVAADPALTVGKVVRFQNTTNYNG